MADNIQVIGDKELMQRLSQLTKKEMDRAYRNALRKVGKIVEKEGRDIVKRHFPNIPSKKTVSPSTHKYTPSLDDIRTYSGWSDREDDYYFKVLSKPHGMLKWYATGTQERSIKKGDKNVVYNNQFTKSHFKTLGSDRGKIEGIHFMKQAQQIKGDEALKMMHDEINKAIQYQWNKYH